MARIHMTPAEKAEMKAMRDRQKRHDAEMRKNPLVKWLLKLVKDGKLDEPKLRIMVRGLEECANTRRHNIGAFVLEVGSRLRDRPDLLKDAPNGYTGRLLAEFDIHDRHHGTLAAVLWVKCRVQEAALKSGMKSSTGSSGCPVSGG